MPGHTDWPRTDDPIRPTQPVGKGVNEELLELELELSDEIMLELFIT